MRRIRWYCCQRSRRAPRSCAVAQTAAHPGGSDRGRRVRLLADRSGFRGVEGEPVEAGDQDEVPQPAQGEFRRRRCRTRLIRRYRNQITPAQLAAYQAVLPDYIVNIYSDRLINYADATVKIVRTQPHGATGHVDVFTRVTDPGKEPFDIIWLVAERPRGKWLVGNVTVSGINLSLTQEADFSAFIAKNGFDALIAMMKSANTKSA